MANKYHKGQTVRIYTDPVFSVSGVATDPTTVTLSIENPHGTETAYTYALAEITKAATGSYYKDISLTIPGIWYYKFAGTGAVAAVDEGELICLATKLN